MHIITKPYRSLQHFVDGIGMYRLVLGSLVALAFCSIVAGFSGFLAYSGLGQLFALLLALLVALSLNWIIALVTNIPANHESAVITAFILFFLTIPEEDVLSNWPLVAAVTIAILSKFIFVYRRQHFMNPAAVGAAALSVTGVYTFSWWVANPALFVPLIITGVLVVMKVRKWVPVIAFVLVSVVIYVAEGYSYGLLIPDALRTFFLSWPTLFLAFYMLTEPFTMPATKGPQTLYGGLVGFLSNSSLVSFSPELALIIGNIFMLPARLRRKLYLEFESKERIAANTYEFVFKKPAGFTFKAGQYLEWMFPHEKSDSKGIRRYFTIAAAPTESKVRMAFKITENGSSYKRELLKLDVGEKIIASQLAGDFLLPKDSTEKLAFVAGGIGVTPFRSHLQYLADADQPRDVALYYCVNMMNELAYSQVFGRVMRTVQLELIPVVAKEEVSQPYESGYLTEEMVKRRTPDYLERTWYLSGPPGMVDAYTKLLRGMGVAKSRIVRDFFPGVA